MSCHWSPLGLVLVTLLLAALGCDAIAGSHLRTCVDADMPPAASSADAGQGGHP